MEGRGPREFAADGDALRRAVELQMGNGYAGALDRQGRILRGLQDGKPLPADRWSIDAPIAVAIGGDSEPYFRVGADALASLLPNVTVLTLPGQGHGAFWAAPEPIAKQIRGFLLR